MLMLSMSLGLRSARGFSGSVLADDWSWEVTGIPSITYSGWLEADTEDVPRTWMLRPWPSFPLPWLITTPGVRP